MSTPSVNIEAEPTTNPITERVVIIHDSDADGKAAAWVVARYYKPIHEIIFIEQRSGINEPPTDLLPTDIVYMVDRTYPYQVLRDLAWKVNYLTVIDHHKSALDDLKNHEFGVDKDCIAVIACVNTELRITINTSHSACMLAWMEFYPNQEAPFFIHYIEDRDIWKWELPDSKQINAGMWLLGHTFENYDKWYGEDYLNTMIYLGSTVIQTQLHIIESIAHGPTVRYENLLLSLECVLRFAIVCCPFTLISDLGNYMLNCEEEGYTQPDVVLCYNETQKGFVYSIRSRCDMIWFAKLFGGGGHPTACGFTSQVGPNYIINEAARLCSN